MTTILCPPALGGHITNPTDPGYCVMCGTPTTPPPPVQPMTTVPAACGAIRHTTRCPCSSARARLEQLIGVLNAARRPWWRG